MEYLRRYHWPGNVRELRNLAERLAILAPDNGIIGENLLPEHIRTSKAIQNDSGIMEAGYHEARKKILIEFEKKYLTEHLKRYQGNVEKTAQAIGFHPVSLRQKLAKLNINIWEIKHT